MKKIFFIASALAGLFFAASCQQELDQPETAGKTVTFTVEAPAAIQTKAIADGLNVDQLIYEVWITNDGLGNLTGPNAQRLIHADDVTMTAGKAEITVDLVNGQNFTILFWAQKKDMGVYNTANLNAVTYNEEVTEGNMTVHAANVDDLAAFYGVAYVVDNVAVKEDGVTPTNGKVTLTRPFAQVNLGTVKASTLQYTVDIKKSSMTLTNVPTVFNVVNGEVSTPVKMTFSLATTEALGKLPLNGSADKYWWAGMNYVFAGKEANTRLSEVSYAIETQLGGENGQLATVNNTIPSVPLRENYRTNIVGNLLTSKTDFEIFVDANFATPDFVEEVWNGSEISEPAYDEATQTYSIEMACELAWIAAAVNGTLTKAAVEPDTFKGKTVKLTKDINLNGKEWTPIGNSTNIFKGTFDGQKHVVSNLVITGNNSNVGLFGVTHEGEIKNLVVENAKVSGRLNVGVVAGTPYTSKYTDITVQGHVEVNGMAYVGGVGGKNAYADWTRVKVEVDKTSYVNANSVENGTAYRTYVGGVVGFNGEGGHKFTYISSNINVTGSTCDVGGLFGIAHYGNQFENCSCSGDVKITAAEEAEEAEEIGGIAGVWHNGGSDVVMNNVTFTGVVTTNIERGTVWYDNLFGKPYNNNGNGKLIVDGIEMLVNGVGLKDGEYYVTSAQGLVWVEAQADNFFAGKTIKLAKNIDMTGVSIEKPIHFWNGRTTFDGQNYTISNLTMSTASTEKKPFSLFTGTADIKNLKFDNANISGYSYVAVVAGNLYGNIDNCHVSNSSVTCTYWMAGALSGQYNAGNVTNCSVTSTTVTGPAAVAALVGVINETEGERKVENCTVSGCTIAQEGSFGGDYDEMFASVVGLINIDNSNVHFNNCNVENTTVKGAESAYLFGRNDGAETVVYINGNEFVTDGVTKDSEGKYLISSAAGLRWVADVVNATTPYTATLFDGKTVKLVNDIDLKNEEWIPIGDDRSQRTEFHGIFDGQGYTVKNVKITKKTDRDDDNKSSYGLFGNLKGTVKNLTVENVSISGAPKFIGALVGRMNDGLIENCHVKNSSVECENWTIGGLLGQLNNGKISRCSVEGTTVKGYGAVAAIAGIALSSGERVIENCSVNGCNIVQNGSFGGNYDEMFGAIVGALYSGALTVNLNNCSVVGTTIKNQNSNSLYGFIREGDKLIIDGAPVVSSTVALSDAIAQGKSVILASDVDFGTTQLTITGENQVVDLGGHALTTANNYGGITLKNGATIKNGTINHTGNTAAIKAWNVDAIENVTINVTPTDGKIKGGIVLQSGADTQIRSIKNVTITGVTNGIETYNCGWTDDTPAIVSMENVTIDATDAGLLLSAHIGKATNCNITGTNYGINMLLKGEYKVGIELENCVVTGSTASIWGHDEKGISNTKNCSCFLTYDAATTLNGPFVWDFEEECQSVVTLNKPQ